MITRGASAQPLRQAQDLRARCADRNPARVFVVIVLAEGLRLGGFGRDDEYSSIFGMIRRSRYLERENRIG
jgi:hypothetical protein